MFSKDSDDSESHHVLGETWTFFVKHPQVVMANSIWLGIDTDLPLWRTVRNVGKCLGEICEIYGNLRMSCDSKLGLPCSFAWFLLSNHGKDWEIASICFTPLAPHLRMFECNRLQRDVRDLGHWATRPGIQSPFFSMLILSLGCLGCHGDIVMPCDASNPQLKYRIFFRCEWAPHKKAKHIFYTQHFPDESFRHQIQQKSSRSTGNYCGRELLLHLLHFRNPRPISGVPTCLTVKGVGLAWTQKDVTVVSLSVIKGSTRKKNWQDEMTADSNLFF